MPFPANKDLPDSVRDHLPEHAQDIYRESFNSALDEYKEEVTAHKVAWAAVKHSYEKNEQEKWVKKKK